jgi:hypothetical protein
MRCASASSPEITAAAQRSLPLPKSNLQEKCAAVFRPELRKNKADNSAASVCPRRRFSFGDQGCRTIDAQSGGMTRTSSRTIAHLRPMSQI